MNRNAAQRGRLTWPFKNPKLSAMRATIELPEEVFNRAREQASQQGVDVGQFLASAIAQQVGLAASSERPAPSPRARSRLPTIQGRGTGAIPNVTAELAAQTQEEEDLASHRRSFGR
jgi:hypothetical protein